MQIALWVDTNGIIEQFSSVTAEQINNMLDNLAKGLAAGYAQQLEEEAQKALHTTRKRYIQNIRLIDTGKLEGTVLLDYSKDPLIQMIEEGLSFLDMKIGFLNSPKVKYTKDGRRYLTIPFRLATPGAVAESDVFSGVLPASVYNVVKNKPTTISVSGGGSRSKGLTFNELPQKYQVKNTRSEIINNDGNTLFKEYQHKNAIYEGVMKYNDVVTGQNTYHSFRRVSEAGIGVNGKAIGSDPDSWIHPGIEAHHLIQVALNNFNVEQNLSVGIDNELGKLGF